MIGEYWYEVREFQWGISHSYRLAQAFHTTLALPSWLRPMAKRVRQEPEKSEEIRKKKSWNCFSNPPFPHQNGLGGYGYDHGTSQPDHIMKIFVET